MIVPSSKRPCLYCGSPTKKGKKGEHIIPEAIGGGLTLNDVSAGPVCTKCNSGALSQIDRELCSRSYLSVVASQEIAAHLWQVWDVDHAAGNLLVEAKPLWADDRTLGGLVCYPQIMLERQGPGVRGDSEEFRRFGQEDYPKVLFKAVRRCFERYCAKEKGALHFERIESDIVDDGYRLPPRVFTRHSMFKLARNINEQSFILRFTSEADKRFALHGLSNLGDGREFKRWSQTLGSHAPTIHVSFDLGQTLRALMKIGLNLIAAFCPNTPVNHKTFAHPIQFIMGKTHVSPRLLAANGFVHAKDVKGIACAANEHSFRLVHTAGMWHIFSSFFGGRIGACVWFPGPSRETWSSADIVAPLKSKEWSFRPSPILQVLKVRVEWNDGRAIAPSFKLQNAVSSMRVEFSRRR